MKNYSLRTRLILRISIPTAIATLLVLVMSFFFARHEIEEVYDAQLVQSAKVLLQLTRHEIIEDEGFHLGLEHLDLEHGYERKLGFRIWVGNDLVTGSSNTEMFGDFEAPPSFSNEFIGKHEWRFFVFLDPEHKIKVEVSERYDIRYELVFQLMVSLILPALIFLPIIFVIIWIGVRKVLVPVVQISTDVDRRGSDDLSPIHRETIPQEIAPLVSALNRLFARLDDSFRREREFTDHAAHELRTPLAAMKTQAQVLAKKVRDLPDTVAGLENLRVSIDRATHLVEQLLSLARLQHEKMPRRPVDLSACLEDVVAEIVSRAERKNISLNRDIHPDCMVRAHEDSLAILLGNLIDNAVKYTPEGGQVDVSLDGEGVLEIADSGPGLSATDKERVFDRFVRADKSGQNGSGLGLSIAKWIADAHRVTISLLDNTPKGLKVRMVWDVIDGGGEE